MRILRGTPLSPGYGSGSAFVYRRSLRYEVPRHSIAPEQISEELDRLHRAIQHASCDLEQLERRVLEELGEAEAEIFAAHLALLSDSEFLSKVRWRVHKELINVESAVENEIEALVSLLSNVESDYLRERVQDLHDVQRRVFRHLGHGPESTLAALPPGTVLVAEELLPSDTLHLDNQHVAAVVVERGGNTAHAAILARALGIAGVSGVHQAHELIPQGAHLLVDGESGSVIVAPKQAQATAFASQRRAYLEQLPATPVDERGFVDIEGRKIVLLANIARSGEIEQVHNYHLAGIGLFRTDYLFIDSEAPPNFERQVAAYRRVLKKLPDQPISLRTLDLGGDKWPRFPVTRVDGNPAFGLRGLRFSLLEHDLLVQQLDAILEAARHRDDVSILFPMVTNSAELANAVELTRELAERRNVSLPKIGAMIETPSAVFEARDILSIADFGSLGTNDLAQFVLALDRRAAALGDDAVLEPSMLRAIAQVVDAARDLRKPLSICGEAAGEPRLAVLLVGLGINQLSMSPVRANRVRRALHRQRSDTLENLAKQALSAATRDDVAALLSQL